MMKQKIMNVVYASDENYAPLVWVSLKSLFISNKDYYIKVYLIADNILEDSLSKLEFLVMKNNSELNVIYFDNIIKELEKAQSFAGGKTSYARLFISDVIDEDKVIYLDCDTMICSSLEDMWKLDIENYDVAGVRDIVVPEMREKINISVEEIYINAGVMLINLRIWKNKNIKEKFVKYISDMNGNVPCHDQGTINHICQGNIKILPAKYNVMTPMFCMKAEELKRFYALSEYYSEEDIYYAKQYPIIIHFTAGWYLRPWFKNSKHPYAIFYKELYKSSPWGKSNPKIGNMHPKLVLMKILYKMLPFEFYLKIAEWKRKQ